MNVGRPSKSPLPGPLLGRAIAARRRDLGLSRAALAARAGLSPNTLMKVEQGQTSDPGVLKVAALSRALAVSVDELVHTAESDPAVDAPISHGIVSVGYEGRSIGSFVEALQRAGVRVVADVRLNAISRKVGFSKSRLRDALSAAGIEYHHMKSLGNAKENRQPFWDGRVDEGRRVFRDALRTPDAGASLDELRELASSRVVAVLCFESDADRCHRKVIIDQLVEDTRMPVVALPA